MDNALEASYEHCQRVSRDSASSFYYSFLLLPRRQRMSMCALYAFLRRTDDLGDSGQPVETRRAALAEWRKSLRRSFSGQHTDPLFPALTDTVRACGVSLSHLEEVIDGVEMDLEPTHYERFTSLPNTATEWLRQSDWRAFPSGAVRTPPRSRRHAVVGWPSN